MDIRNILQLLNENSKPHILSPNLEVMSLRQFLDSEHQDIDESLFNEESPSFLGAKTEELSDEQLKAYLDRILGKKKEKSDKYNLPYIHSGNVPIVDENGKEYDLDKLRDQIKERPKKILKQNEKMQHSDGTSTIYFNVGLPALRGLAVNENNGDFIVVNTCPQAGQCKTYCYAMKGGYVQWKNSSMAQTRLLNFLVNDPDGFMRELDKEITEAEKKYNKKKTKVAIRWHDAGDFFSPEYLNSAYSLAKKHPNTDFYAYTKIASVAHSAKPKNFKINFSMGSQPSQEKQIDYSQTKNSRVVPKELFSDLVYHHKTPTGKTDKKGKEVFDSELRYKDKQSIKALKDRITAKYSMDPKTILTYDEMMKTPEKKITDPKKMYNVIVKPGEGDDSANRGDVLSTLLLIH